MYGYYVHYIQKLGVRNYNNCVLAKLNSSLLNLCYITVSDVNIYIHVYLN